MQGGMNPFTTTIK